MITPIGSSSDYSCRSAIHSGIVDCGVAGLGYRHVEAGQIQGELGDGFGPPSGHWLDPAGCDRRIPVDRDSKD